MKKILFSSMLLLSVLFISCKTSDNPAGTSGPTDCLVGTWSFTENNFTKTFTFDANKTGVEVQAADDIRNFTWSIKNGDPVIVYNGESNEWTLNLDCEKNELEIFMAVYKK